MSVSPPQPKRSVFWSFEFLGTAIIGSMIMAFVCAFGTLEAQIAVLGALISILGGLFLRFMEQERVVQLERNQILEQLMVPLTLAQQHDLYSQYLVFTQALTDLAKQTDPILREVALLKLTSVNAQIESLADGSIIFGGTETWRGVYEALLVSPDIKEYQSVAWVRTKDYWQDTPGRQSMNANFDAAHRGVLIERIIILRDDLWPKDSVLPLESIRPWIQEQHDHGLFVALVRESNVVTEPELLADFGVYGSRACGTQELDEQARTVRFLLSFDPLAVRLNKDRWRRLSIYAQPFRKLLDQFHEGR